MGIFKLKKRYGLKQAAVLEYDNLEQNISPNDYVPCKYSTGL